MVRDVVDATIGRIAPAMVGTANRIALDLLAFFGNDRAVTGRQVGAHMLAVRIEHNGPATLAAIQRKIAAEKVHGQWPLGEIPAFSDDKPAAWERVRPQSVIA